MRVTVLFVARAAVALALFMSAVSFAQEEERSQRVLPLPRQLQGGAAPSFFALGVDNETEFNSGHILEAAKKSGAKRIVLSFWATWCVNCAGEFDLLKKNADNLKKNGVQVYLINVGESIHLKGADVEKFVKRYAGGAFPNYFDPNANTLKRLGLIAETQKNYPLPIIVVLDGNLKVIEVFKEVGGDFPQILWGGQ